MSYRDLMRQAATLPKGDPRNYLVPVEALEGEVQRVGGTVNRSDLSEFDARLSTLSPAQRAFVRGQLAVGRPAVVTTPGPRIAGGLPQQAGFYPVAVPAANRSSDPNDFLPGPPAPQPPAGHDDPLAAMLARYREKANPAARGPSMVGRGVQEISRADMIMRRQSQAMTYAPNGAFQQAVQAEAVTQQRPLAPTDPRRMGLGNVRWGR